MLVGTLPFDRHGGDLTLTLQQVASGVYERPAHVSVEGLDLLDKLLDVVSVGVYIYMLLVTLIITITMCILYNFLNMLNVVCTILCIHSLIITISIILYYSIYTEPADPTQGSGCTPPPFPSSHSYEN